MSEELAKRGSISRIFHFAGRAARNSLAAAGLLAVGGFYYEYRKTRPAFEDEKKDGKSKNVLVIPFNRIQLVEHKDRSISSRFSDWDKDSEERTMQMEVRELVEMLHKAAADPNIVALYGVFGHGSQLFDAGWADLEEVRNALRVFRESHRHHLEPNLSHDTQVISRVEKKPMYAYSNSFDSFGDPSNKEYYLASIFSHVHMQQHGELNLLGMMAQQFFIRDFLNKYGIGVHVFKHGQYKNAPNMFTDTRFSRPHKENVTGIVEGIQEKVCDDIESYRSKTLLTSWLKEQKPAAKPHDLWKRIREAGSFPAVVACKAGLVDYTPRRDPLPDLVESNKEDMKEDIKSKWNPQETDFEKFKADKAITLNEYLKKASKKKAATRRVQIWRQYANTNPSIAGFLSAVGITKGGDEESKKKEKVALLYARGEGGITDMTARKLVKDIRKIGKDKNTKCVVLRVNSPGGSIYACETILQELKGLDLPVVVSFGNVAASGGYYISSGADRIFASNNTVTGSIGVFALRLDLIEMARQYGIKAEQVTTGSLAATLNPFHPLTREMKKNISMAVDRYYAQFKNVVADGRKLKLDHVESLAQGRVYVGRHAKDNGLVDELGGLDRALAFAKRTYTEAGDDAEVVVWPHKESFLEKLVAAANDQDVTRATSILFGWLSGESAADESLKNGSYSMETVESIVKLAASKGLPGTMSGVMMTVDENSALKCLMDDMSTGRLKENAAFFPPSFWE